MLLSKSTNSLSPNKKAKIEAFGLEEWVLEIEPKGVPDKILN